MRLERDAIEELLSQHGVRFSLATYSIPVDYVDIHNIDSLVMRIPATHYVAYYETRDPEMNKVCIDMNRRVFTIISGSAEALDNWQEFAMVVPALATVILSSHEIKKIGFSQM